MSAEAEQIKPKEKEESTNITIAGYTMSRWFASLIFFLLFIIIVIVALWIGPKFFSKKENTSNSQIIAVG